MSALLPAQRREQPSVQRLRQQQQLPPRLAVQTHSQPRTRLAPQHQLMLHPVANPQAASLAAGLLAAYPVACLVACPWVAFRAVVRPSGACQGAYHQPCVHIATTRMVQHTSNVTNQRRPHTHDRPEACSRPGVNTAHAAPHAAPYADTHDVHWQKTRRHAMEPHGWHHAHVRSHWHHWLCRRPRRWLPELSLCGHLRCHLSHTTAWTLRTRPLGRCGV